MLRCLSDFVCKNIKTGGIETLSKELHVNDSVSYLRIQENVYDDLMEGVSNTVKRRGIVTYKRIKGVSEELTYITELHKRLECPLFTLEGWGISLQLFVLYKTIFEMDQRNTLTYMCVWICIYTSIYLNMKEGSVHFSISVYCEVGIFEVMD